MDTFSLSANYFPSQLQQYVFYDKYSRYDYQLGRRETWIETVNRATDFLRELSGDRLSFADYDRIKNAILNLQVIPSMRLLAMAGAAARRNNISVFNCSYLAIDSIDSFVEIMLISMSGCGVGFSVENQYIKQLPFVKVQDGEILSTHFVDDSTEGWLDALRLGLNTWYAGKDIQFNFDFVRKAGAPLKIKGGRASGPEPLRKVLDFARTIILKNQGGRLSSIDAHDIACEIGNASISGGMRRTAMISLFDKNDDDMLHSKDGDFYIDHPQRFNANNSAVWLGDESQSEVFNQMNSMFQSGRGEPGIFNRYAAQLHVPSIRERAEFGLNPCGEILLRNREFCNLSAAIARKEDTYNTLKDKIEIATIIGTIQSMATNFKNIRPDWKRNCEDERLLGVDINGQFDSPLARKATIQWELRNHARVVNAHYAKILKINPAAAITCVKPSGNSSQLVDCSSGIHPRYAPYYIRRVRVFAHSPIINVLSDSGVDLIQEDDSKYVVEFPVAAPSGAITRKDLNAINHLSYWRQVKQVYTEHNPSATIQYIPSEQTEIKNWVWSNRQSINGLTFLPKDDIQYQNAPYEEIDRVEYADRLQRFPTIQWSKIAEYEKSDMTTAAQELACMSGVCEVQL